MTTPTTLETAAAGTLDADTVQAAKAYVDQQLAVMQEFGAAPDLSADAYARLVQEVVAVTAQLRAAGTPAAAASPAAPGQTVTVRRCVECPLIEVDLDDPEPVRCSRHPRERLMHAMTPPAWCPLRSGSVLVTLAPAVAATGGMR